MNYLKRVLQSAFFSILFVFSMSITAYAWEIVIDNIPIKAGESVWLTEDGTLMVDINQLVPNLIDDYQFNFEGWQITMLANDFGITALPNSSIFKRDGFATTLKGSPLIKDQILWLPIESFAKLLNYSVEKNTEKEILTLNKMPSAATVEVKDDIKLRRMTSVFNNIKYPRPDIAYFEDILIPTSYGYIPARIYDANPLDKSVKSVYMNIHGGAYNLGSIASSDHVCRDIATRSGQKVISIDYRMLPEYPFPAGWEDAYTALNWIYENAHMLGIDPYRIVVGGDSAGASIATSAVMMARDKNTVPVAGQMLAYPVTNLDKENWKYLFSNPNDAKNPYATPLLGDLKNMPNTLLMVAEEDTIRPEGEEYAEALKNANVTIDFKVMPGTKHGFLAVSEEGRQQVADFVKNIQPKM